MDERDRDILRRAGYRAEQPVGGTLGECVEKVKEFYIQETMEEDVSREEAVKEVEEGIDWAELKRHFEVLYRMTPLESDPRSGEALSVLREKVPDLHEKISGRTFILGGEFYAPHAVTAPMYVDGIRKVAVIIPMGYISVMSPLGLASTLAHEAIHIDIDENPEKYGLKSEADYAVHKLTGMMDDIVWGRLKELGLDEEVHGGERRKADEYLWRTARYKIWPEDAVFRITACWKGRESKPRWG